MPNTAKSHALQPHAYPLAAREKLSSSASGGGGGGGFSPSDAPLSARPFMTMAATAAPFPAAAAPSSSTAAAYYHSQPQPQRRHIALPSHPPAHAAPSSAQFHSYASYQQQQHMSSPAYSTAHRAMDMYEKLQPTRTGASARAAWRDEIEQRARAAGAAGAATSGRFGPSTLGTKRPAPRSPDASPRHHPAPGSAYSYESERQGMQSFGAASRAYSTSAAPSALGGGALPTLSCLLQRNADASSSSSSGASTPASRSAAVVAPPSKPIHETQFMNKRQRVFAPQPQPQQQHVSAALLARRAADLTGADNRHLRSILEQEVAFYNQRSTQRPATVSGAAEASPQSFDAQARSASRPKPVLYGTRPTLAYNGARGGPVAAAPFAHSDSPIDRASDATSSSPRGFAPVARGNGMGVVADSHLPYARNGVSELPVDAPPRAAQFMHGPTSRHGVHKLDLASLRSPPHRRQQYAPAPAPSHHHLHQQQYDSPLARPGVSESRTHVPPTAMAAPLSLASSASDRSSSSASARTSTTTTSGYRRFTTSGRSVSGDSDQQLSGESVIEAASGLLEERSPSKRESITKLLLKSKEFLKAKSLVRNRNNEIDWVATFLNVGFESSSIYSLMCPLRKGRWKTEEEKYTMELLRLIESGTVRLRHGQSIRGFIAKKLHSDDMRVLKKLSNCKMFHFARSITPQMSEEESIDESVPGAMDALARLETLRSEFLRSVQLEALVAVRKYLSDSSIRELLNGRD